MKLITILCCCLCAVTLWSQDPDIANNERSVLDEIFRSSDHPGQVPVARRDRERRQKRVSVPKGAFRIGCLCMDETRSGTRSTGACSGHGGVRFWVYQTKEGDTIHVLTARHERHPHALNAEEMSEINQKQAKKVERLKAASPTNALSPVAPVVVLPPAAAVEDAFSINDAVFWAIAATAGYFIVRLVLGWAGTNQTLVKYALRNLLRSRKRPTPKPRSKVVRKKRLP